MSTGRKPGRPRKGDAPLIPYEELDRLLVFGEVVKTDDGKGTTLFHPSYRLLAERFGVANSVIADYARKHNCVKRRDENQARIEAKVDQKLVELRSTAIAYSRDEELKIIDGYIAGFEKAMREGRVRFDSPADLNTLIRLKEFILGGADSRAEIRGSVSLEDLQARHQEMMRAYQGSSAEERGEVSRRRESPDGPSAPPARPIENEAPKPNDSERTAESGAGNPEAPDTTNESLVGSEPSDEGEIGVADGHDEDGDDGDG